MIAVLPEINALPRPESESTAKHRNVEADVGQDAFDMRRHVVRPLVRVPKVGFVFRYEAVEKGFQIFARRGIGVLVDDQARGSMLQEDVAHSRFNAAPGDRLGDLGGDHMEPAARSANVQSMRRDLGHGRIISRGPRTVKVRGKNPVNDYPKWALAICKPGERVDGERALMRLAIELAAASLRETAGGPFGAIVADTAGTIIAYAVNEVVPSHDSTAHAEVLAIRRAEHALGSHHLRGDGIPPLRLLTTCAPCLMCLGAIHWAGVPEVFAAARTSDAEARGFSEGIGGFDTRTFLASRRIAYHEDLEREAAVRLFDAYGGEIYNA